MKEKIENFEKLCNSVCEIAKLAGEYIQEQSNIVRTEHIQSKQKHDFVTYVDKNTEKLIVEKLKKLVPEAGFITEEDSSLPQSENLNWIIDPLDGTTNFIHKIPVYSVSIALRAQNETLIGVVYEINRNECFFAWKNGGAYLNNKPIKVNDTKQMNNAIIATGFPFRNMELLETYLLMLENLMRSSRGMRRLGSAAVDLAYVACGRFDGFFEYGLAPWDVAAGAFIIEEAGGKVLDFNGENHYLFKKKIVAGTKNICTEMQHIASEYF